MTVGWFFDGLVILSVVLWLLRLAVSGHLSPEAVALALVGIAVFVAIARASGMGLVRLAFRVGVPVASLWTFVVGHTDGSYERVMALLAPILGLLFAVFGIYVMVAGVLQSRRRRQR